MSHSHHTPLSGFATGWPLALLRLEGAALFGSTLWAYAHLPQHSWRRFAGLLLLPDLGMAGYAANTWVGAALYNAVHTEAPAVVLLCAAVARDDRWWMGWALVWLAHVGMDRMLGYGLKYGTGFGHTHLGVMGAGGGLGRGAEGVGRQDGPGESGREETDRVEAEGEE